MSKDSDVRPYIDGDEKELVKLLQFVFRGWPHLNLNCTDLEHWTWKYRDNPNKPSVIVVAREAAQRTRMKTNLVRSGEDSSVRALDAIIGPPVGEE